MIKLTIHTGMQAGMEFPIDRAVVRIGRGAGNELVLQDGQASRQHAEISQRGEQLIIRDLGSTNGTFVNSERITGSWILQPGDQIRIGETTLTCQLVAGAGARMGPATPVVGEDWESQPWDQDLTGDQRRPRTGSSRLIWGLAALAAVLLIALAVAVAMLLRGGEATPTPVAVAPTGASTEAIVVVATPTAESAVEVQPTATLLVQAPTVELVPTAPPQATAPPVKPPAAPKPPEGVPSSQAELEQLPAAVQQYLGQIPPEQLSQALAGQIQSLPPEQVQQMIGALFPGVSPNQLLPVVAASFPQLSEAQIQGLLSLAFPGQNVQVPKAGPIGGRLVLGIYDKDRDQHNLYLANAQGGPPTLLLEEGSEPDFSPDGQWVVYFSWVSDRLGLRLIKTDGSGDTQLTTIREHGYPTFSPDGGRISFYHNERAILHTINRDGSGMRDIGSGEFPAWSPTGDQIAYRGCAGGGRCGLMVANADGSNPRQITTHANDAAPRWSPNGGQITFHSDRDGNWEIYVINVDGSWLRRITTNPTTDVMPVWSPDGLRIAFRSDRGGKGAVWATSGIGGAAVKLFDAEFDPTWPELAQMDWTR